MPSSRSRASPAPARARRRAPELPGCRCAASPLLLLSISDRATGVQGRFIDDCCARRHQPCLADREGHAVHLPGVAPDLGDEPLEILRRGLETAFTVE